MSQVPDPVILVNYLKQNIPTGNYQEVNDSGFGGLGTCRELQQLGGNCTVILKMVKCFVEILLIIKARENWIEIQTGLVNYYAKKGKLTRTNDLGL